MTNNSFKFIPNVANLKLALKVNNSTHNEETDEAFSQFYSALGGYSVILRDEYDHYEAEALFKGICIGSLTNKHFKIKKSKKSEQSLYKRLGLSDKDYSTTYKVYYTNRGLIKVIRKVGDEFWGDYFNQDYPINLFAEKLQGKFTSVTTVAELLTSLDAYANNELYAHKEDKFLQTYLNKLAQPKSSSQKVFEPIIPEGAYATLMSVYDALVKNQRVDLYTQISSLIQKEHKKHCNNKEELSGYELQQRFAKDYRGKNYVVLFPKEN